MSKNKIISLLKKEGVKITKERLLILTKIVKINKIFPAKNILSSLPTVDKSSIYRNIALFCKLNIIKPVVNLDGIQFFEKTKVDNHDHLICKNCQRTKCVNSKKLLTPFNFFNVKNNLFITGICKKCRTKTL